MNNNINKKIDHLLSYTWGLGLEHEMHIFHKPIKEKVIKDFVLFNSESARNNVKKLYNIGEIKLKDEEFDKFVEVPYEYTGRRCSGKDVILRAPYEMPEFITDYPILSIKRDRIIDTMCTELIGNKKEYIKILMKDPLVKKQVKKYGPLVQYPFGMLSTMKFPKKCDSTKYNYAKSGKKDKIQQEYTGSYHVTITLPHDPEKITTKQFVKDHQNFANQLQWLEPLLLSSFFSCDQESPGSKENRVKGSFRVLIIGWGNLAGSDVRHFSRGIGRYATTKPHWRKGLNLFDVERLDPCYLPNPLALREGAKTTLSSNFRTVGQVNNGHGAPAPMEVGKGVEFRIFDQFDDRYVKDLVKFISLVAENSRVHQTKDYVYQNKHWIKMVQDVMKDGWCAKVTKPYLRLIRKVLGIPLKNAPKYANDLLERINDELYEKNRNGDWFIIMNGSAWLYQRNKNSLKPNIPDINLNSWCCGFYLKCNRNPKIKDNFYKLVHEIYKTKKKELKMEELKKHINKIMGKNWIKDSINISYILNRHYNIELLHNKEYEITGLKWKKIIKNINVDFNKSILGYFD